ncbi:uncharacterized protein LOC122507828 [Leptopilina heterotoma]|uniref:uncharacterized protein LOC122507828 n=1 Tax=Leptopilina heterotoma TaxID=63436 RepID=UPI001CA916F4|nr:uncharacterized protein LOC122507828 [Leptopilina heterotoma]
MKRARFQLRLFIFWSILCLSFQVRVKNISSAVSRQIRSIGFPEGSGMGIFFAVAIPIDIPDKSVSVSFYFEANYELPSDKNASNLEEYYNKKRRIDRGLAYNILKRKFESVGFPGKACLLRLICEFAEKPIHENGLIGDILHILFTFYMGAMGTIPLALTTAVTILNRLLWTTLYMRNRTEQALYKHLCTELAQYTYLCTEPGNYSSVQNSLYQPRSVQKSLYRSGFVQFRAWTRDDSITHSDS